MASRFPPLTREPVLVEALPSENPPVRLIKGARIRIAPGQPTGLHRHPMSTVGVVTERKLHVPEGGRRAAGAQRGRRLLRARGADNSPVRQRLADRARGDRRLLSHRYGRPAGDRNARGRHGGAAGRALIVGALRRRVGGERAIGGRRLPRLAQSGRPRRRSRPTARRQGSRGEMGRSGYAGNAQLSAREAGVASLDPKRRHAGAVLVDCGALVLESVATHFNPSAGVDAIE